jgi:hypothetical protein
MKLADSLTYEQLASLVSSIQGILYLDLDDKGKPCWDPDKAWDADTLGSIAALLVAHDLVPTEKEPLGE